MGSTAVEPVVGKRLHRSRVMHFFAPSVYIQQ